MLDVLGLGATAESVYRQMLEHPDWDVQQLADGLSVEEADIRAALDELFSLALLRESAEQAGRLRPVSPQVGLHALLSQQQAELDRRQQEITSSQAAVARIVAEHADRSHDEQVAQVERVLGLDAILDRLDALTTPVRAELLSITPRTQNPAALETGYRNNTQLLARGVTIRTLMLDSARNDPATLAYAQSLTEANAEVRTAPVLPPRMLIIDRATAIVPVDPENTAAGILQLSGAGVIAALVALFEQAWAVAVPMGAAHEPDRNGVTAQEAALLKLLAHGHSDESAAKRLGVSERTARRMMASLMERLGARSRFEAGLLAAQQGWL